MPNIYIAGIVVAVVIVVAVGVWLLIRWNAQRRARQREERTGQAFLSVRGILREGGGADPTSANEKQAHGGIPRITVEREVHLSNSFSRKHVGSGGVVMPERVLQTPSRRMPGSGAAAADSREDILNFHRQSGNFPKPFSFALNGGPVDLSSLGASDSNNDTDRPASWVRHSFLSAHSGTSGGGGGGGGAGNRYSVMSTTSSFGSEPTTGTMRKVRQLFTPVLPDELLLTKVGEQLTVIQSFDDGWCVVGREVSSAFNFPQKKSLFNKAPSPPGSDAQHNVELGAVPAWCFLKPVKGLRTERPMRSTSLGITVNMDGPANTSRNDLVSWSNF